MKIAALGPSGTYSVQAASLYNPAAEILFGRTVKEVIGKVKSGEAEEAILPLENSIHGIVAESLDEITASELLITDELAVDIHHALCGLDRNVEPVQAIYSHPQALSQCAGYLAANYPTAAQISSASTAAAFETIASEGYKTKLAIGSEFAASKYGLEVIDRNIEDEADNQTRFVAVSKNPSSKQLPFILIAVRPKVDRPGLLYDILGIIKDCDVNMLQIDSRPNRSQLGSYIFYIRLDMKSGDPRYDKIGKSARALDVEIRKISS